MVLRAVSSAMLHPCPLEVAAFLSESSDRVIITERNLRHWSDPVGSEARKFSGVRCDSTL